MPRHKPRAHELTTQEAVQKMFPKKAREIVVSEAQKAPKTGGKKLISKQSS
jgi:hypothetical protein